MANFLLNLGAAFQGQQDYEKFQTAQEQAKLRIDAEKENLAQIKDLAAEAKKQKEREKDIASGAFDYLAGIPTPPQMPPAVQAPPPGQQSQPMVDPRQALPYPPQQRPIGPPGTQGGMPQGMPPAPPQGAPQGPQAAPQPSAAPPPISPYQTLQGAAGPQQMGMQGIPPPPGQPRPNSMSIQDAAQFIKARGVNDPVTSLQILEKLTPYLNNQAKQEAAQLKMQLDFEQKKAELQEKIRNDDLIAASKNYSTEERRAASESANQTRIMLGQLTASIAQQRVNNQTQSLQQKIAANSLSKDDLQFMAEQYWAGDKSVLSGLARNPQALAQVRSEITRQGRAMGKSGADVAQATAEFEGLKAGERALGTRTANIGLAVNEANLLSDLALKTSDEWSRSGIKSLNDLQKYAQGKTASPELRRFVAANNSFINAYARAISPSGAPTVSDKEHARETLDAGFSRGDYSATIDILKQEMEAAKQAPQATKEELRKLSKSGNPNTGKSSNASMVFSNADELRAAIKAGKINKGDTFNDPNGNPHTVN
jgi:hypothetical protein